MILSGLFLTASFLGVVAVSVDRLLAVHLHLRYQELVTHRRVVVVVISIWVYSGFFSLITLSGLLSVQDFIGTITAVIGFIITLAVYIRMYGTVRRHRNQIQSVQIRDEAQSEEKKKLSYSHQIHSWHILRISRVFNLLFSSYHLPCCYSNQWLEYRFKKIVYFLIDSRVSEFLFEPCYLLLEDETHSTHHHGHITKDVLDQQSAISDQLQSVIECRPY